MKQLHQIATLNAMDSIINYYFNIAFNESDKTKRNKTVLR